MNMKKTSEELEKDIKSNIERINRNIDDLKNTSVNSNLKQEITKLLHRIEDLENIEP